MEYDEDIFTCDDATDVDQTAVCMTDSKAMSVLEHVLYTMVLGLFGFMIM